MANWLRAADDIVRPEILVRSIFEYTLIDT